MDQKFETLGNATLQIFEDGQPVLATDPWLIGKCYFDSWALDHPLSPIQIRNVLSSQHIWISHGHQDHLHQQSLAMFPKRSKFLIPDHYDRTIYQFLKGQEFDVQIMQYRKWVELSPNVRCLCIDNENQDAILVIEVGDSLIVNLNDSPLCGEGPFLKRIIRQYKRNRTYLLALCAVDADMINIVDGSGRRIADPPDQRKPGAVWATARLAHRLEVGNFCCFSSQHIYARSDSGWASEYRITWEDMRRHWSRPNVRLIEPFVTVNLSDGSYKCNHPSQMSDASQITSGTGDDDWAARLTEEEWFRVRSFVQKFETLQRHIDFLEFTVGGERRRVFVSRSPVRKHDAALRGFHFRVPRQSLMETIKWGYFDDLLIGNFMRTELINTKLYPHFTPTIAKLGGSARVFTTSEMGRFHWRYFSRNFWTFTLWRLQLRLERLLDWLRPRAERLGIKPQLKRLYRGLLGDPL